MARNLLIILLTDQIYDSFIHPLTPCSQFKLNILKFGQEKKRQIKHLARKTERSYIFGQLVPTLSVVQTKTKSNIAEINSLQGCLNLVKYCIMLTFRCNFIFAILAVLFILMKIKSLQKYSILMHSVMSQVFTFNHIRP